MVTKQDHNGDPPHPLATIYTSVQTMNACFASGLEDHEDVHKTILPFYS
jgi:hypothetical protein